MRAAVFSMLLLRGLLGGAASEAQVVVVGSGSTLSLGSGLVDHGCGDLTVAGTLLLGQARAQGLDSLSIAPGGVLDAGSGQLAWSGDWSGGGQFQAGTSTASWVDGCGRTLSTMSGAAVFHSLTLATTAGREVRFTSGETQAVTNAFTATGAPGQLLLIRSTTPGTAAALNLQPGATQAVFAVDVADNHAVGQPIAPGPAAGYGSVKGSNSAGWFEGAQLQQIPTVSGFGLALLAAVLALVALRRLRGLQCPTR